MQYPEIHSLSDFVDCVKNIEEITVKEHDNGCTVICYMISSNDTFNTAEARECRGITFNKDGKVISRTMEKFFNINEREDTQKHLIDWDDVVRVMDKLDGSMITPCFVKENNITSLKFKSKKSFESYVAVAASEFVVQNPKYKDFCTAVLAQEMTPTFEWTSPKSRIVIKYPEDCLTLLHIRDNVTGEYKSQEYLEAFSSSYRIPVVGNVLTDDFDIDDLLEEVEVAEGVEGYVIQFSNGNMVKLKTPWYVNLHKHTFVSERNVALMTIEESLDDYKSFLKEIEEADTLKAVLFIEQRVVDILNATKHFVQKITKEDKELSRKDFAIKYKSHEFFGLLMQEYSGNEPRYTDYFMKYVLKQEFSTDQL